MLGYWECRCEGFGADSLSHNSHQLRVTAAAARSLTKIRKLHSHVQRQATSSSTTSLSLLFIQFSALERGRETGDSTGGSLSTTDNDRQQAASPGMKTYEQVVISMPAQLKIKRTNWNAYIVSKSPRCICASYKAIVQIHYVRSHYTQTITLWHHVSSPTDTNRWISL